MRRSRASRCPGRKWLPHLLSVLLAGATLLPLSGGVGAAEPGEGDEAVLWSEPARLASRSILLDGAAWGERVIAVGERGHVLLSEDGGTTWEQVLVPTRSMLCAVVMVDAQRAWAVGHDAVILHSADGGKTWRLQHFDEEDASPLFDVWFGGPEHGIAVGAYGLMLETLDGGETWERRFVDEEERHWNGITQAPDDTLYVAAEFGVVFRSRDEGKTWEELATPYQGTFFGGLALSDGAVLVFGLRGNVYRSADRGKTWEHVATDTTVSLQGGMQRRDGTVLIVGLSGTILVSRDDGRTFRTINRPDRLGLSSLIDAGAQGLLLFGEGGIHPYDGPLAGTSETVKGGAGGS